MEKLFRHLNCGDVFVSRRTKRCFGGVKIAPTEVTSKGTLQELEGPTYIGNAVLLTNHKGELAPDYGSVLIMRDEQLVELIREADDRRPIVDYPAP